MAKANRTHPSGLTREQRAAATLLRRHGFAPPVPVHDLTRRFATLEFELIPGGCDGLILGLANAPVEKPTIIVSAGAPKRRQRFTIAHELGHLLLPWHAGAEVVTCNTPAAWSIQSGWEPEANRFAAELLLPTAWVREAIARNHAIPDLLLEVEPAGASAQATCIALARQLPSGFVWAVLDDDQCVDASGTSPNSSARPLREGEEPDFERLDRFATASYVEMLAGRAVLWWDYTNSAQLSSEVGQESSATVLERLLERHLDDEGDRRTARQRIAGIAGSAKSMADDPRDQAEIDARLRRALTKPRDFIPQSMMDDPELKTWISVRSRELAAQ